MEKIPFQKRSKMPNFPLICMIVLFCIAGVITDNSVQSVPNENLQLQTQQNSNANINRNDLNIKHLIEPFAKRRNGFLPSRGKKEPLHSGELSESAAAYETFADDDSAGDDSERMQFIDQVMDKRGSSAGFMPMRGRKSNLTPREQDFFADALEQELDALNTIQKRRAQSFMPMRGRKFDHEYPRFYHRVSPFKPNTNLPSSNSQIEGLAGYGQKRKGMGFFGARGKRSTN